jgi:D-glycero-alpha-D-manno-heptose-7-phosphate kinase
MVEQAHRLRGDLAADVDNLGLYLHDGWLRKKALSAGVSNEVVERAYEKALAAGATGGKLLGAGGSGFLLVYAPGDTRNEVIDALSDYQLHLVQLDTSGSSIIYSD